MLSVLRRRLAGISARGRGGGGGGVYHSTADFLQVVVGLRCGSIPMLRGGTEYVWESYTFFQSSVLRVLPAV